jgi:sugar lactone lactonase YvrE
MGAGQFDHPNGVALDPSGRLYVTDRLNNWLQVWNFPL